MRELSRILKEQAREVDIIGRYGGEEFLILTEARENEVMDVFSRMHRAVEAHVFNDDTRKIHLTVSMGVSCFSPEIEHKNELLARADQALYQAKKDGRNLIRLWKSPEESSDHLLDQEGIETLRLKFHDLSARMRSAYVESTNAFLLAIDAKDHYTMEHSKRTAEYAVRLARALGLPEVEIQVIQNAAHLHDIGKIGIDKEILLKEAPLTPDEYDVLKKHTTIGANILKGIRFLEKEVPIILHHHERYDGSGYPRELAGREIPFGARILSVADAFDAMTTERGFKRRFSVQEALTEIRRMSAIQFDPEIAETFAAMMEKDGLPV